MQTETTNDLPHVLQHVQQEWQV